MYTCIFFCISVSLYVYLSVCISFFLYVCMYACHSVCMYFSMTDFLYIFLRIFVYVRSYAYRMPIYHINPSIAIIRLSINTFFVYWHCMCECCLIDFTRTAWLIVILCKQGVRVMRETQFGTQTGVWLERWIRRDETQYPLVGLEWGYVSCMGLEGKLEKEMNIWNKQYSIFGILAGHVSNSCCALYYWVNVRARELHIHPSFVNIGTHKMETNIHKEKCIEIHFYIHRSIYASMHRNLNSHILTNVYIYRPEDTQKDIQDTGRLCIPNDR